MGILAYSSCRAICLEFAESSHLHMQCLLRGSSCIVTTCTLSCTVSHVTRPTQTVLLICLQGSARGSTAQQAVASWSKMRRGSSAFSQMHILWNTILRSFIDSNRSLFKQAVIVICSAGLVLNSSGVLMWVCTSKDVDLVHIVLH